MATRKKKVYKDYKDYLESKEWQKLRKLNHSRVKKEYNLVELECEICNNYESDIEMHVHHFLLPRDWEDDKIEYHVVLCKECHDKVHDEDNKWLRDYIGESKTRLQFIRNFNHYLAQKEYALLCDKHYEKQHLEDIVVSALKKGLIKYEAEYVKWGRRSTAYEWINSIEGVILPPPQEARILNLMNNKEE